MENGMAIPLTREDGSVISLEITPQYADSDGKMVATGVYELTNEATSNIGAIIFHLDDQYEWEYHGDVLTFEEVEQVVLSIQNVKL